MTEKSVLVTAGFDKALHAVSLAELLKRDGLRVKGVLVVSPFSFKRLRGLLRQRGVGFIFQSIGRLRGKGGLEQTGAFSQKRPMAQLCEHYGLKCRSLRHWCEVNRVTYKCVNSINDNEAEDFVLQTKPDWVVYAGGGILKRRFLEAAAGRVLNAHSGPLPEIRGMNACEWSLLMGVPPGVTIHMINRGIDTGKIMKFFPLDYEAGDSVEVLRERSVVLGVEAMRNVLNNMESIVPQISPPVVSRQCFILSPSLRGILDAKLRSVPDERVSS